MNVWPLLMWSAPQMESQKASKKSCSVENSLAESYQNLKYLQSKKKTTQKTCPDWYGSVGWVSFCKSKGCQFDSPSGHLPGLRGLALVEAHIRGNLAMFLFHTVVFLPLFLPPPLSKKLKFKLKKKNLHKDKATEGVQSELPTSPVYQNQNHYFMLVTAHLENVISPGWCCSVD